MLEGSVFYLLLVSLTSVVSPSPLSLFSSSSLHFSVESQCLYFNMLLF